MRMLMYWKLPAKMRHIKKLLKNFSVNWKNRIGLKKCTGNHFVIWQKILTMRCLNIYWIIKRISSNQMERNRSISSFLVSMLELFIHMHLEKRFITVKNCWIFIWIFKKQDCQKRILFTLYIPLPSTGERGISVKWWMWSRLLSRHGRLQLRLL